MKQIFLAVMLLVSGRAYAQTTDSINIHFALNHPELGREATLKIDSLLYNDVLVPGQKLIILGYADYLGSKGYNAVLSRARAKNVQAYLVSSGYKNEDITVCIGKGKIERAPVNGKAGYADDRKVQIIVSRGRRKQPSFAPPVKVQVSSPVKKLADITNLKKGDAIRLDNIYFQPGRHIITVESSVQLEDLYETLESNPLLKIQIEGHICCLVMWDAAGNEMARFRNGEFENSGNAGAFIDGLDIDLNTNNLSLTRAKAIYDFLVEKGIDKGRLKYIGLGESHPLVKPEVTDADQDKNRRVEVRVVDK